MRCMYYGSSTAKRFEYDGSSLDEMPGRVRTPRDASTTIESAKPRKYRLGFAQGTIGMIAPTKGNRQSIVTLGVTGLLSKH